MKEIIPKIDGIFGHMDYEFQHNITKSSLDLMFSSNYGRRNPAPIIETIQDERFGEMMTDEELTLLAEVILEMYKPKWDKLSEVYNIEYDPIHNYLDEWQDTSEEVRDLDGLTHDEEITTYGKIDTLSNTRTDNLSSARSVITDAEVKRTDNLSEIETRDLESSDVRTDNLTEATVYGSASTRTDNLTEVVDEDSTNHGNDSNSVYGFNSSTAVGHDTGSNSDSSTDDITKTNTGTQQTANTGTDSRNSTGTQRNDGTDSGTVTTTNTGNTSTETDSTVSDTTLDTGTRQIAQTDTLSGRDVVTDNKEVNEDETTNRDRSGRHFGNIGNLTSQKQIVEEINLWRWKYMEEVLNDVKEFCTVPIYLSRNYI